MRKPLGHGAACAGPCSSRAPVRCSTRCWRGHGSTRSACGASSACCRPRAPGRRRRQRHIARRVRAPARPVRPAAAPAQQAHTSRTGCACSSKAAQTRWAEMAFEGAEGDLAAAERDRRQHRADLPGQPLPLSVVREEAIASSAVRYRTPKPDFAIEALSPGAGRSRRLVPGARSLAGGRAQQERRSWRRDRILAALRERRRRRRSGRHLLRPRLRAEAACRRACRPSSSPMASPWRRR